MTNPYLLDLPAVVSFSGGRTSGFMLRHILDAHGGQPEDLKVCFQNTGLEHQATYAFIRTVQERWNVHVTWLEYCVEAGEHATREVEYGTASREGEPFLQLIKKVGFLPNPVSRSCSSNLKLRTLYRHLEGLPGFEDGWTNAVGLRYDEPRRALRIKADKKKEEMYCPMFHAKHTEADVLGWWKEQPFDLMLPLTGNMAGNCVGCFLKSRGKLELLMEEMPEHFEWWRQAERLFGTAAGSGRMFRDDRPPYASMLATVKAQGRLFDLDEEDTIPCMCTD